MKIYHLIILAAASMLLIITLNSGARADVIYLEDGRVIEGDIIEKGADVIKVKTGAGIVMPINRSDIVRIATRADMLKEYDAQLKKMDVKNSDAHMALADWCKKNGLRDKYRVELEAALKADPNNEEAKREITRLDGKSGLDENSGGEKPKTEKPAPVPVEKSAPKPEEKSEKPDKAAPAEKSDKKKDKNAPPAPGCKKKPAGSDEAFKKACDWLATTQLKRGSWGAEDMIGDGDVVKVSICALALMASGSTMTEGPYKEQVKKAVNWMVDSLTQKVENPNPSPWKPKPNWRWGYGCLLLCEAYAKHRDPKIAEKIKEVLKIMEDNQEATGGYGHFHGGPCENGYTELSIVSNWIVSSMGMAKQMGITGDEAKQKKALDYICQCAKGGPMRYSHVNGANPSPGRTAGGMFAIAMNGLKKTKQFEDMANFVQKSIGRMEYGHATPSMHFFGGALGSIQHSTKMWELYVTTNFPKMLAAQNGDGSFRRIKNPSENLPSEDEQGIYFYSGMFALALGLDYGNLTFMSGVYTQKTLDDLNKELSGGGAPAPAPEPPGKDGKK
jgi:hypothetical protein